MSMHRAKGLAVAGVLALAGLAGGAMAASFDLTIAETQIDVTGRKHPAMAVNGQIPGPVLRFREGEEVTFNVTNRLGVDASIHWHGLLVPYRMDGVPGISFPGIKPGETFTYKFPARQAGTYWYHSHSGLQEQAGVYGPLIIDPAKREPFRYDREYVVMLSDWTDTRPETVLSKLKKRSDYYNSNRRTVGDFFRDASEKGWGPTVRDRLDWGAMRMTPTDIADVAGYTFLVNGRNPAQNWTGLFKPGERIRLRFINGSAMSYFDVRIPGLKMTVVQADGNNVQPVPVDEFRIAVAETYDVIVRPQEDRAYTVFAEPLDRSGYARGTLAPREGMTAPVPAQRPRPLLTMADMGQAHGGMDHGGAKGAAEPGAPAGHVMPGMDHGSMGHGGQAAMPAMSGSASGIAPKAANGGKVLVYRDLRSMTRYADYRKPDREITLRLTGNMERYFWSINDRKYSEAEPIRLRYGERVRIRFVNETMMSHPMHLHGMWMQLDTGKQAFNPLKHVVNVAPGETLTVDVPVDAMGEWAFHCHLLYHMATGMFRKVIVGERLADVR